MLGLGIWQYQLWSVVQLIQMWNNVVKLYCHDIKEILFSPYATHVGSRLVSHVYEFISLILLMDGIAASETCCMF